MPTRLTENIGTETIVVPLHFGAIDVPNSAGTAAAYPTGTTEYIMPWSGSVIGISANSNADYTGGTLTFNPTIDGAEDTDLGVTLSDTVQRATAKVDADKVRFAAGARLGVEWSKTGTVAPTTTDVTLILWVMLDGVTY